ncbi:three-helix bundle dimerization domain-containing protein [Streptomyces sp. NPDC001970]
MSTDEPAYEVGDSAPPKGATRGPGPRVCADPAPPQVAEASAPQDEDVAIRHVAARLKTAYPSIDPAIMDAVVATAYGTFEQAKIRTYIPILVTRRVRSMLSAVGREGATDATATAGGSAVSLPTTRGTAEQSTGSMAHFPLRSRWRPVRLRPAHTSDVGPDRGERT